MKNIFDKTEIKDLKLKNRLFRSATWEALADENGHFDEEIYRIYDELAAGGVGCIISGFTSVSDNDRYFGGMARLSNDGLMEMLTDNPCKRVTVPKGEKKEKDIYTLEEVAQLFQLLETAPLKYPQCVMDLLREYKAEQDEERIKLGTKWTHPHPPQPYSI